MRAIVTMLLLSGLGCGAAETSVHVTMTQALAAGVTDIELDVFGAAADCLTLRAGSAAIPTTGLCATDFDTDPPCVVSRVQLTPGAVGDAQQLFVPSGSRTVAAIGFDDAGQELAFACAGPLTVSAGETTEIELELK